MIDDIEVAPAKTSRMHVRATLSNHSSDLGGKTAATIKITGRIKSSELSALSLATERANHNL